MTSAPLLRPFQDSDAEPLTVLLHEAYAELAAMGLNFTAVDQDARTTRARALGGQCWVVEEAGDIIGTITMSLPPPSGACDLTDEARVPRRVWLNQLAVSPSARRRGIASSLWRCGWRWARDRGATSVGLDTAIPAAHLQRMYEAWGFATVGTIHWPGKTYDSVVMTRELGELAV